MTPTSLQDRVEEQPGREHSIPHLATARTAFVGRTLRGPVDRPTSIKNFAEFQHVFGGLWQPSPLGYAVEQFFDNGGREALIVRVANGARAATLTLGAGTAQLHLRALRPGTREFLRASVDYDNIPAADVAGFNLTIQRVRAQGTGHVEDQEIFHRLSMQTGAEGYLPQVLAQSELVRAVGEMPAQRPDRTLDPASGLATAYVHSNADGDDGAPLSDYDVIGSPGLRTGMFALQRVEDFNLLCIPPLSRGQDVGMSVLLIAARYCKERRALLIVDPPANWHTADDALAGLRSWDFASENALMYFPRVLAHDKLRGHFESFAPCGAVAGMLARNDEQLPLWVPSKNEEAVLRPGLRPACLVAEDRRARLAAAGINVIQAARVPGRHNLRARTLAAGSAANRDWQYLASRRLALHIINSIERGTRWIALAQGQTGLAEALAAQVRKFLDSLSAAGAFGARGGPEAVFVICNDSMVRQPAAPGEARFIFGFAAGREREYHSFRVTHSRVEAKVQAVTLNRLSYDPYSPAELDWVDRIASQLQP